MKLTVSCQICGRIIQEVDNGLGDDVPFSPEASAQYAAGVSCEVDGTANITTFFTRTESADALQIRLGIVLAQLQDSLDQINILQSNISQLQYDISLLSDPEGLVSQLQAANDQLQQDQITMVDLQQQVQTQTSAAQTLASAMHQVKSLGENVAPLGDQLEYQITSLAPNLTTVKALLDEFQVKVQQMLAIADDSLSLDPPQPLGIWVNFPPEHYDDFQTYLASQDPVVDPISALDGSNMVEMTSAQYILWQQFKVDNGL